MKPLLCTQCGAPLKGEKCEYCDVSYKGFDRTDGDAKTLARPTVQIEDDDRLDYVLVKVESAGAHERVFFDRMINGHRVILKTGTETTLPRNVAKIVMGIINDASDTRIDFERMSRADLVRYRQLLQESAPSDPDFRIASIKNPQGEVAIRKSAIVAYYDKKMSEMLEPMPSDWPSETQGLLMRHQLVSKLKKHTLKDTVCRMHELLQKIRNR